MKDIEPVQKKTRGRQRVPMMRMERESNRQVTFSKRRLSLFKKANELCTLCRVEAAIIVFSPGRKAYSFGHPSVDAILNRYMHSNTESFNDSDERQVTEAHEEECQKISNQLSCINENIESEKKRCDELLGTRRGKGEKYYQWLTPMEELDIQVLNHIHKVLENLRVNIYQTCDKYDPEFNNNVATCFGSGVGFSSDTGGSQFPIQNPFGNADQIATVPIASASSLLAGPNNDDIYDNNLPPLPSPQPFNFPGINNFFMLRNFQGNYSPADPGSSQGVEGNNNPPMAVNFQGFPSLPQAPNVMNAQAPPPPPPLPPPPFNFPSGSGFGNSNYGSD